MAYEPEKGARGYLYGSLADGVRPFVYRSRLRSLLGLPHPDGVQMNFAEPLPIAGFSYVVPRFTGEFELPDELFASGPKRGNSQENRTLSVGRVGVTPNLTEPATREKGSSPPAASQSGEIKQLATKAQAVEGSELPPFEVGKTRRAESIRPQTQPGIKQEFPAGEAVRRPTGLTNDASVHDLSPDPAPRMSLGRADQSDYVSTKYVPTKSDHFPPATRLHSMSQAAPSKATGEGNDLREESLPPKSSMPVLPEKIAGVVIPARPTGGTILPSKVTVTEPGSAGRIEPQLQQGLPNPGRAIPRADLLITSSHQQHAENSALSAERFPSVRQPNRRRASGSRTSSETREQRPPEASPVPTAATVTQVVVDQGSVSATPAAFWERRYLNHLRVRIRR